MIVRELVAMLGFELDESGLDRFDEQIRETAGAAAEAIVAIGAAVAAGTAAAVQSLIEMGDELGDAATQAGLSAQEMAEWDHVAQLSGTSAEAVRDVLSRLPGVMDRVAGGNRSMRETFAALGVTVTDADGSLRSSADVLQDLVGGLSQIRNPAQRAAMATRVFGRRGAELAGLIEGGADGVARLRSEVRSLYGDDLEGFVAASGRAADAEERLSTMARALAVRIGSEVLPTIADMLDGVVEMGRGFMEASRGVDLARVAIIALTGVMSGALVAAGALALSTVGAWGPVAVVVGLVTAAAVGLGFALDDVVTFLEGGDSLIGAFLKGLLGIEQANAIMKFARSLISGISEDLSALTGIAGPELRELVAGALTQFVVQMAAIALGVLVVTRGMTWLVRTIGEGLSGAWQAATAAFDSFVARVLSGVADARRAVESITGFLGISTTGASAGGGSVSAAAPAERVVEIARSQSSSATSRAVSVGQIVVQGVSDAGAAAEAIRDRITSMLIGDADAAREDLVPEVDA